MSERKSGKCIKWMDKGFGFIQDVNNTEHFVHFSALQMDGSVFRKMAVGQEVEFDVSDDNGKTRAENVTAKGGKPLPACERQSPSFPPRGTGGYAGGGGAGGGGGGVGGGGAYSVHPGYLPRGDAGGYAMQPPTGVPFDPQMQHQQQPQEAHQIDTQPKPHRMSGKCIKWIEKGYGFIQDDKNTEYFVHFSALQMEGTVFRKMEVGQEVEFDVLENNGKTRAENVTAKGGKPLPACERQSPGYPPRDAGGYPGGVTNGGAGGFQCNVATQQQANYGPVPAHAVAPLQGQPMQYAQ